MAWEEIKVPGWPKGWTQRKSRRAIVLSGPDSEEHTFMISAYPQFKDGITREQFIDEVRKEMTEHCRHAGRLLSKLGYYRERMAAAKR